MEHAVEMNRLIELQQQGVSLRLCLRMMTMDNWRRFAGAIGIGVVFGFLVVVIMSWVVPGFLPDRRPFVGGMFGMLGTAVALYGFGLLRLRR